MTVDTVYEALVMPVDESRSVYTSKLGYTESDAKDAALNTASDKIPITCRNVDWDERVAEKNGWRFVLKEKVLHGEPTPRGE